MSEKLSGDVPPPPEFNGNVANWAREMGIYIEQVLRDHNEDIRNLYETKADA